MILSGTIAQNLTPLEKPKFELRAKNSQISNYRNTPQNLTSLKNQRLNHVQKIQKNLP
jgi:hypothetical protein